MSELPFWLDSTIVCTVQQLKQDFRERGSRIGNVQILLGTMANCKNRAIAVAQTGGEKLQLCQNEVERGQACGKWYESLKQVFEATYSKIAERMQELGTYINQDVALQLRESCEMFRVDMGEQLGQLKLSQRRTVRGIGNVPNAVDTRLIHKRSQKQATGRTSKADMYIADKFEWQVRKEHSRYPTNRQ